jgi:hypothetical protein
MAEEDEAKTPKADVFSAGIVSVEMNSGVSPNPGPAMRKEVSLDVRIPDLLGACPGGCSGGQLAMIPYI